MAVKSSHTSDAQPSTQQINGTVMSEPRQAYCMRCKTKRDMVNPVATFSATGTAMTRGVCAVCGANLSIMGATPAHEGLAKPTPAPRAKNASNTTKATKSAKAASKKETATKKKSVAAAGRKSSGRAASGASSEKKAARRSKVRKLVIVESPAKARTVGNFLGSEYTVMASKGHIRDLLVSQLSVDVQNDFEPKYRVPNEKRETVADLKRAAADAR